MKSTPRWLFGRALLLAADDERAEQMLQQATLKLPADPLAFYYLAEASEKRGHYEPARRALLDYIALAGEDLDARRRAALATRVGDLSMQIGDYPLALASYERAAPSMAADGDFMLKLAEAKWRAGDLAGARAIVDKMVEKDPSHTAARTLRRRMRKTYRASFGSTRSRRPSPRKLNPSTKIAIARPGKIVRCGASKRCERPASSIVPQLGVGG